MKFKLKRGFPALLAISAALSLGIHSSCAQIKVACVGDSITAGYGLSNPGTQSYPAQLQTLLGSGYNVGNYGWSGATALKQSDNSYWNTSAYRNSKTFKPNIVIIMFGANDSKSWNWNATNFNSDYLSLIAQYQGLTSHPKVYVCYTTPMFMPTAFGSTFDPVFIENTVEPAIAAISTEATVPLIDNQTILIDRPDLFQDGVHPTPAGAAILAQRVADAMNGLTPTNITTATITSSGTSSVLGAPVTFTATVSSASGTPSGSVIFAANYVPFSTNTLSGGTASVTYSLTPAGDNVIAAQYVSQGTYLGITHSLHQIVTDPNGPALSDLGASTPVPGSSDIFQLSTAGDQTAPDGINYYTDNNPPVGQTFTTGPNPTTLTTLAIKTAGLNDGNGYGTPSSTPLYYLRIYSVSGSTATLLNTFSAANPGFTDGDWLQWSNLNVSLNANQTYAFTFGIQPAGGGWVALAVATNAYSGGEIVTVPINGGTITTGSSHAFDAVFDLGLSGGTQSSAPAAPTGLAAVGGTGVVNLNWTQSVSPGITGNNVYRSTTGSGGPYNLLANLSASTSYADTAITAGSTYFYSVTAVNTNGESALSAYAGATTVSTAPAAPTSLTASSPRKKQIALNWTQSTSPNITNNKIYRATTSGGPYTLVATISPATSYNDTGLSSRTTYYYVVTAINSGNLESSYSSAASATAK